MQGLTIQRTSLIIIFMLLVAMALRVPTDTDTWWHIRSGDYILENGTINGDPFSHTKDGETWINHSWGSQLLMLGFWSLAGNAGLAIFTAVFAVSGMGLLYAISAGNVYLKGFVLILGAATAAVFWSARPQMISFFFTTVILWLMYSYKRYDRDLLWMIIPVMWLWGNFHAGWAIGYLFLIAFIVGEAFNNILKVDSDDVVSWAGWGKLTGMTIVSIPFLILSPYLLDNLLVPFNTVSIEPLRAFIQEWQSPNFQGRETWVFIAMIMLLFMALWTSNRKFDWSSFFLLIGTLFLALLYSRNIAVFAVVAVPILTYHLDDALTERGYVLRPRRSTPRPIAIANILLIVFVALGILLYGVSLFIPENLEQVQSERLPVAAVQHLYENDYPPTMFNSYNWGGYLMFTAPDYPVYVDGRTDLYGDFVLDYAAIYFNRVDDMTMALAEHDVNVVLVETGAPIIDALEDLENWSQVYEDELAVIWIRSGDDE